MQMVNTIHHEHGQISRLLRLLREQLQVLESGERTIEYPLIQVVVDYMQTRADKTHHPKEDILYRHLKMSYPDHAATVADLEAEHEALKELTEQFTDTLTMILMDAVIPLEMLKQVLTDFVDRQQAHLEFEERQVLPLIKKQFTAEDWTAVEALWQEEGPDPLFGERVEQRYQVLARRLAV